MFDQILQRGKYTDLSTNHLALLFDHILSQGQWVQYDAEFGAQCLVMRKGFD